MRSRPKRRSNAGDSFTPCRAIATLEQPYREVVVMRDLEGLSGLETCQALGLTLATMKTRLQRARLELRRRLEHVGVATPEPRWN